jgi:hypothetical protein
MMVRQRIALLLTMLGLQAGDLLTTIYATRLAHVSELNPLLSGGFPAMLTAKLFSAGAFTFLVFRAKRLRLYWLLCILFGCVVINNALLLRSV